MNTKSSKLLFTLVCTLAVFFFQQSAVADKRKVFQDGETVILGNAAKEGEKDYMITVLFWHESPHDYLALQGIIEGFRILRLPCTISIRQVLKNEQKVKAIIAGLKSSPPDLIYSMGTEMTKRVMAEIHDTPIVFTAVTNPVQSGITPNWKSSGCNVAGNSNWIQPSVILDTFKKTVPTLKKLGVMYNSNNPVSSMEVAVAKRVLKQNNSVMELVVSGVTSRDDLQPACKSLINQGVDAIWIPIGILIYKNLSELVPLTVPAKIPMLSSSHRGIKDGAVLGLAVDYVALGRKSVVIANKILSQGIAPKDIPIGRMHSYQTIVNLRAANRIGHEIPLGILAAVDFIAE